MPFNVPIPTVEAKAGWKAKIFDNEGAEEPHVSVIRKDKTVMRISLRSWQPLVPPGGALKELPPRVLKAILNHKDELCQEWDERFPHNPVPYEDEDDEE